MRPFFGTVAGLTLAVLSLSALPVSFALPTNADIVHREAVELDARPLYYENRFQRVYRNDDHSYIPIPETVKVKRAQGTPKHAVKPKIHSKKLLGDSSSQPDMSFVNLHGTPLPTLPKALYAPHINTALTVSHQYSSYFNGSGSVSLDSRTKPYLEKMEAKPRLSRDGGLGGKIGDNNIFMFADTASYTQSGTWTGFVSNSVASNTVSQAKIGKAPVIHDKLGEWANNQGTMRNWIPFTKGEAAFNAKMAGHGQRYAIWPLASIIPLDHHSALVYAPIVFTNTNPNANLETTMGMTVAKVTIPGAGGAIAERLNPMLFSGSNEVEWGNVGGIRSFGPSGVDGGKVYVLGNTKGGLMLGRVEAQKVADSGAYEFWHKGGHWSSSRPTRDSTDTFMNVEMSTGDIFYSPHHSTFIMVYMTAFADNKFYWRYLQTPHPIKPSASDDFVENITKHPWSDPELLMDLQKPAGASYAYAGGMHRGYFNKQDITNGGTKMLLTWTQPTGQPPQSVDTAYYHRTAEVSFS